MNVKNAMVKNLEDLFNTERMSHFNLFVDHKGLKIAARGYPYYGIIKLYCISKRTLKKIKKRRSIIKTGRYNRACIPNVVHV